jgi:FtsP/CotA-like multicopper oxidase with cupredoxin domain
MDGVPGVQQCPIAPGESYTYRFRADLYGTSWYHSHFSSQYTAGLFGAMIVYGPPTYPYDTDLGPVLCNDYYHTYYTQLTMELMSTNEATSIGTGTSDNNLINGKNNFNCSSQDTPNSCVSDAGLSKFFFEPGKVHRLRFINSGAEGTLHISIDGHTMRIIAVDFVPVEAVEVQVISLGIAQRCDVLVTGTGTLGESYWMRSTLQPCSGARNPSAKAAIYYPDADQTLAPTTEAWPDTLPSCVDMPPSTFVPYYSSTPPAPSEMAQVNDFKIEFIQNSTGYWLWTVNGVSYRSDYNEPTLLLTKSMQPNSPLNFPAEYNVYTIAPGNNTNQFVMYHVENTVQFAHPMHLHGHNMWLVSQGDGTWDGTVVRANNPPRRDVFMCPAGGHLVVAYEANNPGIWPFHCHIAWHIGAGLFVQGVEQPDWIQEYMTIPTPSYEQCRTWWSYTGHTVVPEIDSGL